MFKLDEIRTQLRKYDNDPACVDLLKELEHYYGYDLASPGTSVGEVWQKLISESQEIYSRKNAVKKQQGLIEFNKKMKIFMTDVKKSPVLNDAEKKIYIDKGQEMLIDMACDLLGVNRSTFLLDEKPKTTA